MIKLHLHKLLGIAIIFAVSYSVAQEFNVSDPRSFKFFMVSDIGQNGYYQQREVAQILGTVAEKIRPKFIISSGDTFHYNGVRSTSDPLWISNFESIYTNPWLLIDWFPILGNHEYRGNTQAVIDYSAISRRWNMPSRYYTFSVPVDSVNKLRLVFIDSSPFINFYKRYPLEYPDVMNQNNERQLIWLDSVLTVSDEKWKIVIGHHPIYSADRIRGNSSEMLELINPILMKHKVDFYFSGHIHIAQHLQQNGIDYVVNPSGSLGVGTVTGPDALAVSHVEGFTVCALNGNFFEFIFVDKLGKEIYRYQRNSIK